MNYRHAFHAGNFADVLKHLVLTRILVYQTTKATPLRYIDTHAGLGWYDLAGNEATRTGEWRNGIGRLVQSNPSPPVRDLIAPYLDVVGALGGDGCPAAYPGSPGIAQHLLRPTDRLLLCEKHPDDAAALRIAMGTDKRCRIIAEDGYATLNAALPPPERRGLVLIDPPFEDKDEFAALAVAIDRALRKWATGTYVIWYPLKTGSGAAAFLRELQARATGEMLHVALARDPDSTKPTALHGCGLAIINPPFVLADELTPIVSHLVGCLEDEPQRAWRSHVGATPPSL